MERISNVDYHITDKCNLLCVCCNHFCPLVPTDTQHKSMEQIQSDLLLLSKIKDNIDCVTIMGGEPTLHPRLNDILYFARRIFPNNEIHLTTNGTRYKQFYLWKDAIINNNIKVLLSQYPFTDNYKECYQLIQDMIPNNCVSSHGNYDLSIGLTDKMQTGCFINKPIVDEDSIRKCRMRGGCCQLKNGRLYICNYAANFNRFDDAFKGQHEIIQDENDYVDLNTITTYEESVYPMVYESIPSLCRYCTECQRWASTAVLVDWKKSDKAIGEWYTEIE